MPTWTVDDALRMQAALAAWLPTSDGAKCAYAIGEVLSSAFPDYAAPSWDRAKREAEAFGHSLAASTLIWCDPPMVDMWAAAADTYPEEPLEAHQLPDQDGLVILAKPLPRVIDPTQPQPSKEQISAISWSITGADARTVVLLTWTRHRGLDKVGWGDLPGHTILAPGLSPSALGVRQLGSLAEGETTVRLLQTLSALIRSPMVDESAAAGSKAARKAAARSGIAEPKIRRVYLRRPEHAANELQAARELRAGRALRGHWVSGHWKRQWYPSVEDHRWVRIEGYPRGDFTAGQVSGPKARVVRGDR